MWSAFRSFALISIVSLICAFLVWGYVRASSMNEPVHTPLSHPFLQATMPAGIDVVAYRIFGDSEVPQALTHYYRAERLAQLEALPEQIALWIDLHPLRDGNLVAGLSSRDDSTDPSLTQVLQSLAKHRLILNFRDDEPGMVEKIAQSVNDNKASERILFQSSENGFLKDLRTAQPQWIFGTSQAQVTRLIMLAAIGLQAAAPLKSDVFVMETRLSELSLERLTIPMIEEIHRRAMKIYAGPADTAHLQQAISRGVNGLLSHKPEELLASLQKK